MLTPVDLQNKTFKGGIGFDKKEVEAFMSDITADYSMLYRSNVELHDKIKTLSESLQHYKSIEDSMQKALTISEKTSEETINAANDKARQITTEAELKAEEILKDSKKELQDLKNEIFRLKQQEQIFKEQFRKILRAELRLLDGEVIDIDLGEGFESSSFSSGFSSGVLGSEGGLGGGYTGSTPSNFEKTAQSPTFDRGSNLGMDPFASAANGGRFSKQTGGDYTGAKKRKSSGKSSTSLNIKTSKSKTVHRASVAAMAAKSENETYYKTNIDTAREKETNNINEAVKENVNENINENIASNINDNINSSPEKGNDLHIEQQVKENIDYTVNTDNTTTTDKNNSTTSPFDNNTQDTTASAFDNNVTDTAATAFDSNVHDTAASAFDSNVQNTTANAFVMNEATPDIKPEEPAVSEEPHISPEPNVFETTEEEESALSGEVENKVNESTMLDSQDNYSEGFDFIAGNEEEEEDIPTIIAAEVEKLKATIESMQNDKDKLKEATEEMIDNTTEDEEKDVFVGDVENKVTINESRMIGNDDDVNETFKFM